ncbi:ATP-binding response regulator [Anaeromyxobacter oryzisoli]|uniref:ATP-binding response regulator n=1 Tax=Anaeromyxobacter oryzisoli TaxID=2925408 RepID=UPI001F55AB5F|nr:hybrid sensor histidine kinase/response regulator [Anaeromyxobacter sp. SG63]
MARVLCIEGDEALRARARVLLESAGYAVDTSATGLEGIDRALTAPPDLIVADVHLPDLEGYELAARLRREQVLEGVPIVAIGDSPEEHDVALAAGADGFVLRALDDGHLPEEVRDYLAGKRERLPEEGERRTLKTLSGSLAARLESALTARQRADARLARTDQLKSAFVRNLSHQLSTPLTPLAGYLRILQSDKLGTLTPQQRRIVDAMAQSVARLTRIVDNLSDFASLEAAKAFILEGEVDPDRLAEGVVSELRGAIQDARLHVAVAPGGGGPIVADARKLRQALWNLVSNAVKFSPHGGEVLVEVVREPGKLRFAVYDQGPGIRPGDAELLFEPLFHAASRGREDARPPGSGLGLPVARRIAEAHGGRVWVESPPRSQPSSTARVFSGSKFVLEIPVRPSDRPAAGTGSSPAASIG